MNTPTEAVEAARNVALMLFGVAAVIWAVRNRSRA